MFIGRRILAFIFLGAWVGLSSAWRDTTEESSRGHGCADQKSGDCHSANIRPSEYQHQPQPDSTAQDGKSATTDSTAQDGKSATTDSTAQDGTVQKLKKAIKKQTFFITNLDFKSHPMIAIVVGALLFMLVLLFVRLTWIRFRAGSMQVVHGRRRGGRVGSGTVLVCIRAVGEEAAEIYEEVGSQEVIGKVEHSEKITAAGGVEDNKGCLMVPIQPRGAVALHHFREERALAITSGTILIRNSQDDEKVYVFDDNSSNKVVGKVDQGDMVVAKTATEWSCEGHAMVPVRPQGAVELCFFDIKEGVADDEMLSDFWMFTKAFSGEREGSPEVDEKMRELKKQRTKILLEQAARKKKLETVIQAMLEHEAEKLGKTAPTDDEVKLKTEESLKNANMATQRSVMMAVAYAAPLVTQSQRIYQAVETRVQICKEKGTTLALEESKSFTQELQKVLKLQDMSDDDYNVLDDINIPSLATILASLFAPAQLRILYAVNRLLFFGSVAFVMIDVIVLIVDYTIPCMNTIEQMPPHPTFPEFFDVWWKDACSNHIYLWFLIDCVVHFNCVLVRLPVLYSISAQLDVLDRSRPHDSFYDAEAEDADTFDSQDIVVIVKRLVELYMTTGFGTLQQLDAVLRSYAVFLANFSIFFDVCWITYGTYLMWNTPWTMCSNAGLLFLRLRSTIFLSLFVFYILQLVFFILGQLLQSESFSIRVVRLGDSIDEGLQLGLPVAKVLLHALVIRHSSDMIAIQLNMHKTERERLIQQQKSKVKQLEEVNHALEAASKAIAEKTEESANCQRLFKDAAALQADFDERKEKMAEKLDKLSREVSEKAVVATRNAEQLLEEWERGEGPEVLAVLARGEGLAAATETLMQDTSTTDLESKEADDKQPTTSLPLPSGSQPLASIFAQASALAEVRSDTATLVAERLGQGIEQTEDVVGGTLVTADPRDTPVVDLSIGDTVILAADDAEIVAGGTGATRRQSQPEEGAG